MQTEAEKIPDTERFQCAGCDKKFSITGIANHMRSFHWMKETTIESILKELRQGYSKPKDPDVRTWFAIREKRKGSPCWVQSSDSVSTFETLLEAQEYVAGARKSNPTIGFRIEKKTSEIIDF